ncbi:MAG TPA: hypothetical protein VMH91_01370 [Candidatus Paceibacterota bacterium]|nr:hypothetical protein [Candidatus Paceibacterota bacterium]
MLILLGGFLGSGRKMLAKQLAYRQKFYLYDTEAKKMHHPEFQSDGSVKEVTEPPKSEEQRMFLYKRIVDDFPRLSKMYPDTVIEEAFHRIGPRDYFITEAKKFFDPVVFVWVDSDEAHVEERMRRMVKLGLVKNLSEAMNRRRRAARHFNQDPSMRVFKCVKADSAEADALWTLVRGIAAGKS